MAGSELDELPDSLLLLIFNKVADIKALGRCCAVSKRFNALVPQVETVLVKVDCVISGDDEGAGVNAKGKGILGHFVRLMLGSIAKPLQALQQLIGPAPSRKAMLAEVSHHSPGEVLKNFKDIRHLRIELPGGELGIEDGVLLRWRAEFGSTLESCVVLGAASVQTNGPCNSSCNCWPSSSCKRRFCDDDIGGEGLVTEESGGGIPESFYVNGGLKMRVVWTISSLIAASARHFLLREIIWDHPTLQSLVLTDADGQGTLFMGEQHLAEFRRKPLAASASSSNRTQVPALNMKLRYAPYLQVSCGTVMQGATLVTIRPSSSDQVPDKRDNDLSAVAAFEGPARAAAKMLAGRRTYLLEMNSF